MSVEETKKSIQVRISARPQFAVVPAHAIALFDRVMEETEVEAFTAHKGFWARVDFWKAEVLRRVTPSIRGLVAVQFHEYIAALARGGDGDCVSGGFDNVPPYGGEARAQHDAYIACTASLA
jgi:hypothetical protein